MTDDKNKVTDKAGEIAKNIWLAGVGAYGRAVDEAQGRLEKAGVEPPKLFRELVKAGAALEDEARDAIEAGTSARHSVEDRINRVRENFNLQRPARGEDLLALHEKIDRLANRVDALTDALNASGSVKPPRKTPAKKKRTPTRSKTAAKARPSANKKPAAKKPQAAKKIAVRRKSR
ncbi:phasin family protein [Congregibacter sp.]|uniref:phasin family protein n=1 Tax=Congregibacter sp. TaxID=2744308 RepID=UPI003F6C0731